MPKNINVLIRKLRDPTASEFDRIWAEFSIMDTRRLGLKDNYTIIP